MTTIRVRSLVSVAAALTITLGAAGCATGPARLAAGTPAPANAPSPAVQFENTTRDYVRVYLVGQLREWPLGRVAPGATVTLRLPEEALAADEGQMRLAVLTGDPMARRIGDETRAITAIARPTAEIVGQRWTFTQRPTYGELTARPFAVSSAVVSRP